MFPLLKYSSSIITFYFYCVHLLQINFTVNPITPIEYIPWQWSDQFKISWEKRLFSKVTHTLGKLYYANKFTYVQQKSAPIESVGWQCPVDPSCLQWHKTRSGFRGHYIYIYICIFMNLGGENGLLTFFFSKAIVTPTCGPRKKPSHPPNPSAPTSINHHILKRVHLKRFRFLPTFKICDE